MVSKKNIAVWALAATAAPLLILTQTAGSNDDQHSIKLEGTWISRMPGTPVLSTSVMTPIDPSGRRAAVQGCIPVRLSTAAWFPDYETSSDFAGEAVMTGSDTATFTVVAYGTKRVDPALGLPFLDQLVFIWVDSGELKFTAPGKAQATHHMAYYSPEADVDGDGLPDPGQTPVVCLTVPTLDTRVGLMPACEP